MEEQQIILQPEMAVIGGGAVTSVNGYTGDVVLTTSDLENTSDYQTGSEVEGAISIEATAREAADNNLQTQIDAISASSDVTDIVGTYAELQNYDTSTLGNNDIIKVLQDESQNGETTYYRWSTTTQSFTLIGEEGPYYTKAQADVLLNAKQDTLTAGANIQISNNTISATDTTYSNFTGTDGTAAGAAGLVPAPATTDAGKFLKADGTWDDAGGGGSSAAVVLTSADNNYHSTGDTDDGIAVWKLDRGYYKVIGPAKVYWTTSYFDLLSDGASRLFIIAHESDMGIAGMRLVIRPGARITGTDNFKGFYTWSVNSNGISTDYDTSNKNGYFLSGENVASTTGTSTSNVMSQKAVTDMVFADGRTTRVQIGSSASASITGNGSCIAMGTNASATQGNSTAIGSSAAASGDNSLAVGRDSVASNNNAIALGRATTASGQNSIAIGWNATATQQGQFDISTGTNQTAGYNSSNYRLLTGLYDPQSAHDAATKGYVDTISSYSETEADTGATWIDGKTIYKKSYQQTITSNTQTFSLGITNLYEVVKMEAIWHAGGTLTNGMPTTTSFPGDSGNSNSITVLTYGGTVEIDSSSRNGMKGVITIYYTKSS